MPIITSVTASDRDAWLPLWNDYLTFYAAELTDEVTALVFARLAAQDGLHGACAL